MICFHHSIDSLAIQETSEISPENSFFLCVPGIVVDFGGERPYHEEDPERTAFGVFGVMLGRLTMKKIRAICDIQAEDVELKTGTILEIVEVVEDQIVVRIPEGEYYCMSSEALETGFEIAEN